jgi:hypothetical protein
MPDPPGTINTWKISNTDEARQDAWASFTISILSVVSTGNNQS